MKNSDLISREALLRKAQALLSFDGEEVVWVRDDVLLAPTIDPVRALGACYCAECKRFKQHPTDSRYFICDDSPFNTEYSPFVKPTDFCSYGERRK